jgi:subfamily B ATP-binding cassette protein MsbA
MAITAASAKPFFVSKLPIFFNVELIFLDILSSCEVDFKYLKASSAVYGFKQKLETTIHTVEQERKAIGIRNSIFFGVREPLVVSIVLLILFVNFNYMKVEFSVLFILLIFFYRALNTLSLFQSTYNNFLSYSGSLLNVFNQLEEFDNHNSNQIDSNIGNLENEIMDITEIDIKNLGYSFNQNAVFDNLSFKFKNSHIYGVVGKSGSGKTTLLNIISGLYRNYQGEIIVNSDVDLRSISQRKYSKSFGIITQESVIFEDTLFNNITLWDIPNLENQERFLQSIKFAQLEGFLEGLELKGEAQLSADGKNISGGQRQRISIAREIYKGAHVLIFDEPTAALDVETSAFIREKIAELRNNHIIILVSHDIDNLDFCDKYLMLKNNEVREIADFKELLEIYSK